MACSDEKLSGWANVLAWLFPMSCGAMAFHPCFIAVAMALGVAYAIVAHRARQRALVLLNDLRHNHGFMAEDRAIAIARLWK